jgi:hypothetical protein
MGTSYGLRTSQQFEGLKVRKPLSEGFEVLMFEQGPEARIASENEAEDKTRVHLEVCEDAQSGEDFCAHILCLIDDEENPAVFLFRFSAVEVLEFSEQNGIGTSRLNADAASDFAIHVAL